MVKNGPPLNILIDTPGLTNRMTAILSGIVPGERVREKRTPAFGKPEGERFDPDIRTIAPKHRAIRRSRSFQGIDIHKGFVSKRTVLFRDSRNLTVFLTFFQSEIFSHFPFRQFKSLIVSILDSGNRGNTALHFFHAFPSVTSLCPRPVSPLSLKYAIIFQSGTYPVWRPVAAR